MPQLPPINGRQLWHAVPNRARQIGALRADEHSADSFHGNRWKKHGPESPANPSATIAIHIVKLVGAVFAEYYDNGLWFGVPAVPLTVPESLNASLSREMEVLMVAVATRIVDGAPIRRTKTIEQSARELLANHEHFRGRAHRFLFADCDGVLVVQGCVPSFYLKQVLQCALKNLRGVRRVDNQVDVICCRGLSNIEGDD
jgi:hypothetical protein